MSRTVSPAPPRRSPTLKQESLGMLVRRVRDGLVARVETALIADGVALTHSQFMVIRWLGLHGACGAGDLARALDHDPGALTRLLDRLAEKGYLRRTPQIGDRRALSISLTAAGEALWAAGVACIEDATTQALRDLSAAERKQLLVLLKRVALTLEADA